MEREGGGSTRTGQMGAIIPSLASKNYCVNDDMRFRAFLRCHLALPEADTVGKRTKVEERERGRVRRGQEDKMNELTTDNSVWG